LFNTTFWVLVEHDGMSGREAEERLKVSARGKSKGFIWVRNACIGAGRRWGHVGSASSTKGEK